MPDWLPTLIPWLVGGGSGGLIVGAGRFWLRKRRQDVDLMVEVRAVMKEQLDEMRKELASEREQRQQFGQKVSALTEELAEAKTEVHKLNTRIAALLYEFNAYREAKGDPPIQYADL